MKIYIKRIGLGVTAIVLLWSCSRKKNSFLSRNYHAVTAEYNILFNGNEALKKGVTELKENFQDNYWEILAVEQFNASSELSIATTSQNPNFATAEEKAIKAIQKHGMLINGKENNPQMDDAYMLLGKSRYFDQRFIPSQEAFNYILYRYPASDKINEAKIWREKTNLRLQNDELAVQNLKKLIKEEQLNKQERADAYATLAQAFINLNVIDSAAIALKKAAILTKHNSEEGRYKYIVGQLYNRAGKLDSANAYFQAVVDMNRKISRRYYVNAKLEQINNTLAIVENDTLLLETLLQLEKSREHRPYLGRIHNQMAEYFRAHGQTEEAILYYNKSLNATSASPNLMFRNYNSLAELNYKNKEYTIAGAYYDSTLTSLEGNPRLYRDIKQKRDNLEDVINYEAIKTATDSILTIIALPEAEQRAFYEMHIAELKAKQEALLATEQSQSNLSFGDTTNPLFAKPNTTEIKNADNFYFYNDQAVAFGKNEFRQNWGTRKLQDNWRWAESFSNNSAQEAISLGKQADSLDFSGDLFQVETYLNSLPKSPELIDSLKTKRNKAYYQLALLYKEKFNDYDLAKQYLNQLLSFNPPAQLIVPAKYELYKIYVELNETASATAVKNTIITNYPDTRYAQRLLNNTINTRPIENATPIYDTLYKQFEAKKYEQVISGINSSLNQISNEALIPKLELLKATAIGRLEGLKAYNEALSYVALTYPNSDEGKQAQSLINEVLPELNNTGFKPDTEAKHFNVLFEFKATESVAADTFLKRLKELVQEISVSSKALYVTKDPYTKDKTVVVIHGFSNKPTAMEFKSFLSKSQQQFINKPYIVISSENYRSVQIHKNLNEYIQQLK